LKIAKTWIREHSGTVQMQGGNFVAKAADAPLPGAPQGGAVRNSKCVCST